MTHMAQRVANFATTIFTEMTALAVEHQAVNLGQGFPDFEAPDFIKEAAQRAIAAEINQYAPLPGRPDLRRKIANQASAAIGREIDPDREVAVMVGATEGIFATIMGLVDPGDEVIIFEPYYDSYVPTVQWAGGVPRYYTLEPPDWGIDPDKLRALFSPNTRMICINTPHNPTGKVFSKEELAVIAELCREFDVIAMVDAVYEHIVFDGAQHHSLAALPGMAERTVSISSLGKTFSVTGWKTGWTIASPEITRAILRAYQFVTFSGIHPFQAAAAAALTAAEERGYFTELAQLYEHKRDLLLPILREVGLTPLTPQGTYFVMVDISHLDFASDVDFCKYLTREVGVAAIPPSAFYHDAADGAGLARFTFCKRDEVLEEAGRRLKRARF